MNIARRKRIWHAWQRRSPCCFLDDLMVGMTVNDAFDNDEYWWESDMLDRGEALPASFHPSSSLTLQNILLWWNIFQIFTYSSKYPSVICVEAANILQISSTSPLLSEVAIVSRIQILTYSFKYPSRTSACSQKQNKFPVVKYLANVFSPLPPSNPVSTFSHRPPLPPLTTLPKMPLGICLSLSFTSSPAPSLPSSLLVLSLRFIGLIGHFSFFAIVSSS